MRSGQWGLTLAALAVLGLAALPLQAQSYRSQNTQQLLSTLTLTRVESNASYGKLGRFGLLLMPGQNSSRPACVLLINPDRKGIGIDELEAAAQRFLRVYKLQGYNIVKSQNNSVVLLLDGRLKSSDWYSRGEQAGEALSQEKGPAPVVDWLNAHNGDRPHRYHEGTLYWRKRVHVGSNWRDMEVAVNVLQPPPFSVDVRVRGISPSAVPEVLEESLNLSFSELPGARTSALRRKIGTRAMAAVDEGELEDCVCLVKVGGENNHYRLADVDALVRLRGQRDEKAPELPEVEESLWADEIKQEPVRSTPAPAPKPQPTPAQTQQPAEPVKAAEPAMPTPAEAREAFIQRLKSL